MRWIPCLALVSVAGCAVLPSPPALSSNRGDASRVGDTDLVPLATALPVAPQSAPDRWRGSFSVLSGLRQLDEDRWNELDEHPLVGLDAEARPDGFPLGIEFGVHVSYDEQSDFQNVGDELRVTLGEAYIGPRLTGELGSTGGFRPYAGGGITAIGAYYQRRDTIGGTTFVAEQDDVSLAGYAHTGFQAGAPGGLHLGLDLRWVFGSELDGFGTDVDADYWQLALLLGTSW